MFEVHPWRAVADGDFAGKTPRGNGRAGSWRILHVVEESLAEEPDNSDCFSRPQRPIRLP